MALILLGLETLLNHIRGEFQLAQVDEVLPDIFENLLVEIGALQFKHILDQVVSIGVFDKVAHLVDDLEGQLHLLLGPAFLKTALDHAAAVLLFTDLDAVSNAGVENELRVLLVLLGAFTVRIRWLFRCSERCQEGLNNVVTVGVDG